MGESPVVCCNLLVGFGNDSLNELIICKMNQKFAPVELLVKSSNLNNTGYFEFTKGSVAWRVYLQEGKLKYVDCSIQLLVQLKYYLLRQGWKDAAAALKDLPQSYLKPKTNPERTPPDKSLYEHTILWLLTDTRGFNR